MERACGDGEGLVDDDDRLFRLFRSKFSRIFPCLGSEEEDVVRQVTDADEEVGSGGRRGNMEVQLMR